LTIRTNRARDIVSQLNPEKTYVVEIQEDTNKRSGQQNRLYWEIVGQIAKKLKFTPARVHNMMLRDYGEPMMIEGKYLAVRVRDTKEAYEQLLEDIDLHLLPSKRFDIGDDGLEYRYYYQLKGSRQMNTAEMNKLIDGAMQEAKNLNIELIYEE